jgi:hypothetical protein
MGGRAGGGDLVRELREHADWVYRGPGDTWGVLASALIARRAADRIEALEAALAEQIGRCAGCGGSGWATVGAAAGTPCPYCRGARRALEGEG